jgi:hypothetical protein
MKQILPCIFIAILSTYVLIRQQQESDRKQIESFKIGWYKGHNFMGNVALSDSLAKYNYKPQFEKDLEEFKINFVK